MAGGYTAPSNGMDSITGGITDARRQLRDLQRPQGTNLSSLVAQVQALLQQVQAALVNIQQTVETTTDDYLSAGTVAMGTINASGDVTATGSVDVGTDINLTGDLYTPHGRATPVVSGYVAAYINTDGRLGASASARRFKQDITPHAYTLEQIAAIQIVSYRLRAAVTELGDGARVEIGVIAEQLIDAGLSEFVVFGDDGQPQTVAYERLDLVAVAGVQQLANELADIKTRLTAAGL